MRRVRSVGLDIDMSMAQTEDRRRYDQVQLQVQLLQTTAARTAETLSDSSIGRYTNSVTGPSAHYMQCTSAVPERIHSEIIIS